MEAGDRGISAIWVVMVMFFLMGAAALAVDASGGFGTARTDQNTADLACLAGVDELPDQTAAIYMAVGYIDANWPTMAGSTLTLSLPTATYDAGNGNVVFLDADHGGSGDAMYLRITEVNDASFGRVVGHDTITVTQEAACSMKEVMTGVGMLPIGALTGPWSGDLFDCAAKVTGNCGALAPDSNGANAYRDAVANGIAGDFIKHHGNRNLPDGDTGYATIDCYADPCNVAETEPGNMVGPWYQALTTRFSNNGMCREMGWFNCDPITTVFPGIQTLAASGISQPGWWEDSLYGTFAAAKTSSAPNATHYYFNGPGMKCDHTRIATVPIVNIDLDWDLGDGKGTWPNGRKDMKLIGFYTIYIREPNTIADIGGPIDADVIWFGPDTFCESGEAFQPPGNTVAADAGVKLVAP